MEDKLLTDANNEVLALIKKDKNFSNKKKAIILSINMKNFIILQEYQRINSILVKILKN